MTIAQKFHGICSAIATPIDAAGEIDVPAFVAHGTALLAEGCSALAPLGTTGEANSFGIAERKQLIEGAIDAGLDPHVLMPGTGLTNVPDTIELTQHAARLDVRAVLLLPPFYYKDVTEDGLFRYFSAVVDGVASERLRVILYHIPQMTGVPITQSLMQRLVSAYPGVFVGLKDSAGDLGYTQQMIEAFPSLSILAGSDRHLWPALKLGGDGCITASSNLITPELRSVLDNWQDASALQSLERTQSRIEAWRNIVISNPQTSAIKLMLAKRRKHDGWTRVRAPMTELSPERGAAILSEMARLDALRLSDQAA